MSYMPLARLSSLSTACLFSHLFWRLLDRCIMQALMLRSLALIMVCSQTTAWLRAPTLRPPSSRNGFLDDALDNVKSGLAKMSQTATVQHVLVPSRTTALKLQRECRPSVLK